MKLQYPFVQLPVLFDAAELAEDIARLGESAWKPHSQGFAGNSMLPLVAVDGDPDNDTFAGPMRPTRELEACPRLVAVLGALGATIGRTRLMRLSGQAEVTRHADQGYYWAERVRVHVPIVTQPTVRFECGGAVVNMAAGECWIFDTWRQHRVLNDAEQARIHLVSDTVGGSRFWEMVARGRRHDVAAEGWAPSPAPLRTLQSAAELPLESVNVPLVMSPWELAHHLRFLLDESLPHPALGLLQQHAGRLVRDWRGLWARYGTLEEGREHYRQAIRDFTRQTQAPGTQVALRNQMRWHDVMVAMVASAAVAA